MDINKFEIQVKFHNFKYVFQQIEKSLLSQNSKSLIHIYLWELCFWKENQLQTILRLYTQPTKRSIQNIIHSDLHQKPKSKTLISTTDTFNQQIQIHDHPTPKPINEPKKKNHQPKQTRQRPLPPAPQPTNEAHPKQPSEGWKRPELSWI